MKAIVTDGNNRAALAITRSLGKAGYEIIVGAESNRSLASSSKFCIRSFKYPDPADGSSQFVKHILEQVEFEKPDVILPVSEITTLLIMSEEQRFKHICALPFFDYQSVSKAASKYSVIKIAQSIGIPVPTTVFLENSTKLSETIKNFKSIKYPIVVKPSRSRIFNGDGWHSTVVQYARDFNDLETKLSQVPEKHYPILLQERITGPGVGVFVCFHKGKMIASFSHQRIREKPPSGGVSVLRKSIPVDGVLKSYSAKLLSKLNWQGVAMIEFKKNTQTGEYRLMEINGRFWGSLQLAIDSGVDFPLLSAKISVGDSVDPINQYKIGVKTRWLMGDIDALLFLMLKPNKELNLPEGFPNRIKYLVNFLKPQGKDLNYEILKLNDIRPWLFEIMRWLFHR